MANDSSFQLEHQCPQCGADVTLHESDRILSCRFCRVRLVVRAGEPPLYYFPAKPGIVDPEELFYVPYWRLRGVAYGLSGFSVVHRVLDTTVLGCDIEALPYSLGVRPQAVTLRFLTPEAPGRFLKASLTETDFLARMGKGLFPRHPEERSSSCGRAFIGETVSLIHTPFRLMGGQLEDGLTGRRLGSKGISRGRIDALEESTRRTVDFWSTLCPECGWDLQGEKDSTVLLCPGCRNSWEAGKTGFERIDSFCLDSENAPDAWLPFWQIRAEHPSVRLDSLADFARFTELPGFVRRDMESEPFAFWIPAFHINPSLFLRLSRQMTVAQHPHGSSPLPEGGQRFPCNLPAAEALEFAGTLLAALSPAKERLFPLLRGAKMNLKSRRLLHVPFNRRGSEYIQPRLGFSLPHVALQWGRALA